MKKDKTEEEQLIELYRHQSKKLWKEFQQAEDFEQEAQRKA
jgi:hypothetical protein